MARGSPLHAPLSNGQILAQRCVEWPAGLNKKIVETRAFGGGTERLDMGADAAAILLARVLGGNLQLVLRFHVNEENGAGEIRLQLLGIKHMKKNHFIAARTERPNGV